MASVPGQMEAVATGLTYYAARPRPAPARTLVGALRRFRRSSDHATSVAQLGLHLQSGRGEGGARTARASQVTPDGGLVNSGHEGAFHLAANTAETIYSERVVFPIHYIQVRLGFATAGFRASAASSQLMLSGHHSVRPGFARVQSADALWSTSCQYFVHHGRVSLCAPPAGSWGLTLSRA